MWLACQTCMAVHEVFRFGLRERHELLERLEWRLRPSDQHVGREIAETDVAKALHCVRQLLHMRLRGERIVGRECDRVAVGRGPAQIDEPKGSGCAALVHDNHGLAQRLAQFVLQCARHDVGVAAWRKRHDQIDGTRGIGLRECAARNARRGRRRERAARYARQKRECGPPFHGKAPA